MLTPTETNLLILMTFVIMFGLGCTLSIDDFKDAARHPKPALVGFLSQYLIMPALAFGMAKLFNFSIQCDWIDHRSLLPFGYHIQLV